MSTTVRSIVEDWLKTHAYDGLRGDYCGCGVGDLMPCDGPVERCKPGYRGPDPEGEFDFLTYPSREARDAAAEKVKKGIQQR